MELLLFATDRGVVTVERVDGKWEQVERTLPTQAVTSITVRDERVLAGTPSGVFRSENLGQSWEPSGTGLTVLHIRWLAEHPQTPGVVFAGTEPADIFVSEDAGENWEEKDEVVDLRDEKGWNLPYSPEAGCVRGFAFHGDRGYAAVEQGGLLRSDDRGRSWQLAPGSVGDPDLPVAETFVHHDVHSVEVHPSSADLVFAPTGGGLYRSADGGETWGELYDCYCRAVWVDPDDPDHIIFGPADGVDRGGRIARSIDGGESWEGMMGSLEDDRWSDTMVERFNQIGEDIFAVLSNGDVLVAPLDTLEWKRFLPGKEIGDVNFVVSGVKS